MQTTSLFKTLKRILRKERVTYIDIADALHLSEASVKRMFSRQEMSLGRFDQVLKLVNLDFSDLVSLAESETPFVSSLSPAQEKELVSDEKLLLVAIALRNKLTVQQIVDTYSLEIESCRLLLKRIEALGLIEIRPNDQIKPLMSHRFSWIKDGHIERFFKQNTLAEFFDSGFDGPGETFAVAHGMLSRKSNQRIRELTDRLVSEFYALYEEDAKLPHSQRFGATMIVAMRPLELSIFKALRRPGKEKHF